MIELSPPTVANQIFESLLSPKSPHFKILADQLDAQAIISFPKFSHMLKNTLITTVLECWPTATSLWTSPAPPKQGTSWPLSIRVLLSGSMTPSQILHFNFFAHDKATACLFTDNIPAQPAMTLNPSLPSDIQGWIYMTHNLLQPPCCTLCHGTGEVPSEMCHCGDYVKNHGFHSNHSPVEMMDPCSCLLAKKPL